MSFLKHSLQMVLWRGVTILLGAATAIMLARWLGPEDRGELTIFLLWISLAALVLQLGFPEAVTYLIAARIFPEEQTLSTVLGYFAAVVVVAAIAGYFLLTRIFDLHALQAVLIVAALSVSVLVTVMRHILIAHKSFSRYSLSIVLEGSVYLAGIGALHAAAALTVDSALSAYALSLVSSFVLLAIWQWHTGRGQIALQYVRRAVIGHCFRYGLHLFTTGIGGFVVQRVNYFLLEWFSGSRAVGLFAAANSLPALFANLPQQLATVLYSHVAKSGPEQGGRLALVVVKVLAIVCVVLLIPVFIWRDLIASTLFGPEFAGIGPAMVILSAGMALAGLGSIIFNALAAVGLARYGSYTTYSSVVLVTVLGAALIPRMGIKGAAWAQVCASVATLAFVTVVFCRTSRVNGRTLLSLSRSELRLVLDGDAERGGRR